MKEWVIVKGESKKKIVGEKAAMAQMSYYS